MDLAYRLSILWHGAQSAFALLLGRDHAYRVVNPSDDLRIYE